MQRHEGEALAASHGFLSRLHLLALEFAESVGRVFEQRLFSLKIRNLMTWTDIDDKAVGHLYLKESRKQTGVNRGRLIKPGANFPSVLAHADGPWCQLDKVS